MRSVRTAWNQLINKTIPAFADKLANNVVTLTSYEQLTNLLHEHGINVRCVGACR